MAAPYQPRSASITTRVRTTPQGLRCADCGGSVLTARPGLHGIGAAIHGMAEKIRLRLLSAYCAYDDTATFASPRFMADRDLDQHAETRKARTERSRILASPNL